MDYREAGVDIEAGRAFVEQIRSKVIETYRPEVIGGLGGFGGYFQIPTGYQQPVLVSGTDGVGTKLNIAQALNQHTTIGIDLVAMCVNDILTSGAEPLFFLDYLATGKLEPAQLREVIVGIVEGCKASGCALLGGETAEMPGFYSPGEYDVAGFCVGIVEKSQLLDGSAVADDDVAIALASSGVHSNGYSLVRKIVAATGRSWQDQPPDWDQTLGETFLTPTQIYVRPIQAAIAAGIKIKAMAHITGGGLPENLPRALPPHHSLEIDPHSWQIPPVFEWLAAAGKVDPKEMFNTFNMGIGFVIITASQQADQAVAHFKSHSIDAYKIGRVVPGNRQLLGLFD